MASTASTPPPSKQSREERGRLDTIISRLLGQGLGYDDWKQELENRMGIAWNDNLKNTIIKKELDFFREEILGLQSEPNRSGRLKSKTNSLESILKRLQGLEWAQGLPNEMEQRRRERRLLGKDTKVRCFQYHVSRWSRAESLAYQSPLHVATNSKEDETNLIRHDLKKNPPNFQQDQSFPTAQSFPCRTSPHFPFSAGSSTAFHKETSRIFNSAIFEDTEIPWVPPVYSQEDAGKELDDFFQFSNNCPAFPSEAPAQEPSFELPRMGGVNDSYSTYVYHINQDPALQKTTLEGILNYYGSQQIPDTGLSDPDWNQLQETADFSVDPNFIQPQTFIHDLSYQISQKQLPRKSLSHIQSELGKKRHELLAAESKVSTLQSEIELLEGLVDRKLRHTEGTNTLETAKQSNLHKRINDATSSRAKRLKADSAVKEDTGTAGENRSHSINENLNHTLHQNSNGTMSCSNMVPRICNPKFSEHGTSRDEETTEKHRASNLKVNSSVATPLGRYDAISSEPMQCGWPELSEESGKRVFTHLIDGFINSELSGYDYTLSSIPEMRQNAVWAA